MVRKFLMLAVVLMITGASSQSVFAEQPAAETYRQMFRKGDFYVEFNIVNELASKSMAVYQKLQGYEPSMYASNRSPLLNMFGKVSQGGFNLTSGFHGSGEKTPFLVLAGQNGDRILKEKANAKIPAVMYQDNKYYKYAGKNLIVLAEDELYSPFLDPTEGWQNVIPALALPDELAIFCWNDPYRDLHSGWGEPIYVESSTKTIKKTTYDYDRYASDIKDMAGNLVAQEVYDALYENGNLVMIQKSFLRDGNERLIETVNIKNITSQVPDTAFAITKKTKVYAAHNGDMNDLLEIDEQVGEIGGKKK